MSPERYPVYISTSIFVALLHKFGFSCTIWRKKKSRQRNLLNILVVVWSLYHWLASEQENENCAYLLLAESFSYAHTHPHISGWEEEITTLQ